MAIIEKLKSFSLLFKRIFRRYKLLHDLRALALTASSKSKTFENLLYQPVSPQIHFYRNFFSLSQGNKRREFSGRKLVGFSMEEMYNVVSDVENYKEFVPFCKKSHVIVREDNFMKADLIIGFPPVVESYTSHVTMMKPNLVVAQCKDTTLFKHLETNWKFSPGLSNHPRTCVIHFFVSFEFKSIFHSHLANLFFNEVVKQMENAFYEEAIRRYGKPTVDMIKLKLNNFS